MNFVAVRRGWIFPAIQDVQRIWLRLEKEARGANVEVKLYSA
jgi:hypothetical protein